MAGKAYLRCGTLIQSTLTNKLTTFYGRYPDGGNLKIYNLSGGKISVAITEVALFQKKEIILMKSFFNEIIY